MELQKDTSKSEIVVYKSDDKSVEFQVLLDDNNDTFWATEQQIAAFFNRDRTVINKHISNVFKEKELNKNSVRANFAHTTADGKIYQVKYYNLDVIISVGYRVKSKIATEFRIWATKKLKQHLIQGYSLNERRLKQLQQTIQLVNRASKQISNTDEAQGLMEVLSDYSRALDILDDYDHQKLSKKVTRPSIN